MVVDLCLGAGQELTRMVQMTLRSCITRLASSGTLLFSPSSRCHGLHHLSQLQMDMPPASS